jgi:hydrogenase nickel incorporation protein HypB
LHFDVERCIQAARRVNPAIEVIQLSATTGAGMDDWLHWLEHAMSPGNAHDHHHHHHEPVLQMRSAGPDTEAALRRRVAELEAALAAAARAATAD